MPATPNHWLIGVRASELDAGDKPKFLRQLHSRLDEDDPHRQQTLIRRISDAEAVHEFQARYGKAYASFFYIDDALLRTSQKLGIGLHPLELVFGPVDHAEIYASVTLPMKTASSKKRGAA